MIMCHIIPQRNLIADMWAPLSVISYRFPALTSFHNAVRQVRQSIYYWHYTSNIHLHVIDGAHTQARSHAPHAMSWAVRRHVREPAHANTEDICAWRFIWMPWWWRRLYMRIRNWPVRSQRQRSSCCRCRWPLALVDAFAVTSYIMQTFLTVVQIMRECLR